MVLNLYFPTGLVRMRDFERRMLRRIFGLKRDEVTGEWRRLLNKELYALYSLPDIMRMIESKGLRWAEHVARMGRVEVQTGI